MFSPDLVHDEVGRQGFASCPNVLSSASVDNLTAAFGRVQQTSSVRKRSGVFAVRNLLDVSPEVEELAHSTALRELVEPGPDFFPVRGILFDKIAGANWKVPWHQDVTIAVQGRVDAEGFGPWSIKSEVLHVQPPACVLERMLSVRLHLDPCGEQNGALRVIPGTHLLGRIPEEEIATIRQSRHEHLCALGVGGALLMRPLLLHASSPSQLPMHRRVVHLDFAAVRLPVGIHWFRERNLTSEEPHSPPS